MGQIVPFQVGHGQFAEHVVEDRRGVLDGVVALDDPGAVPEPDRQLDTRRDDVAANRAKPCDAGDFGQRLPDHVARPIEIRAEIDDDQRAAIMLIGVEGYSYAEAAAVLDVPGAEYGSGADLDVRARSGDIRPGALAAYVFRFEDEGERMKR